MLIAATTAPTHGAWARLDAVVAIPVNNEAERIGDCLAALAAQRDLRRSRFGVVLLLNNCTDATADIALAMQPGLPFPLRVVQRRLPPSLAHAGWARRLAMESAAAMLGCRGVILTTDADGRVDPGWITANLAAIDSGAELVAGYVRADRAEHALLPQPVIARGRLEARYDWLLTELAARLDPVPHDPWPHHRMASGASLAIRLDTYRRIGGLSPLPLGEDRALAAAVAASGGRIRHSLAARVVVSCRLDGRAEGGMATTIRQRVADPGSPCDSSLERVVDAVRRARWRATLRRLHRTDCLAASRGWANALQLGPGTAEHAATCPRFGEAWALIEERSPALARRALCPSELPLQITAAKRLVARLRADDDALAGAPPQHVDAIELGPRLVQDSAEAGGGGDESPGGLVAAQRVIRLARPMYQDDIAAWLQRLVGEGGHSPEIDGRPVIGDLGQ